MTVWLAILEISTGKGLAANAGHEHPLLRRKDGHFERVVYRHSPAVAVMEGIPFREHSFEMHPGDSLFVYTDGVPEATDMENKFYGTDRMVNTLNACAQGSSPKEVLDAVSKDLRAFVGDAAQLDDVTMMSLQYRGPQEAAEELRLPAETDKLGEVLDFIDTRLTAAGCPEKTRIRIDIAVEEIFVNIAHYAYDPDKGDAVIRLRVKAAGEQPARAFIELRDFGKPFDPLAKPDPDVTLNVSKRQIGGLGIFMVKKSMDEVSYRYEDGQNILLLEKDF